MFPGLQRGLVPTIGLEDVKLRLRLGRVLVLGNYGCLGDLDGLLDTSSSPTFPPNLTDLWANRSSCVLG